MITKIKTANREEWRELRSQYIGGSDAAAIVGLNPYSSQYSLFAEKTGRVPGFEGNLATEVGAYMEEFVAKKFEQETGKKVRRCNRSILNGLYPWAIANIDREIIGEDAGLEIKTTDSINLKRFKGGEYPANYYTQCVHYLCVTGKQRWYLAVLIGNKEFRWYTIERDEAEITELMDAEREFYDCIKSNTPPVIDGSKATSETIKEMYPASDGGSIFLPHGEDIARYMELTRQIKQLETMRDAAANRIKEFMGSAEGCKFGQFSATWTTSERKTFDVNRFAAENPNIDISGYYKTTSSRVFRVKEAKHG